MSLLLACAVTLALAAALVLAGGRLRGRLPGDGLDPLYRGTLAGLAGLWGFALGLAGLDLVGIPWNRWTIVGLLALLAVLAGLAGRQTVAPSLATWRKPGWGEWIALAALLVFTVAAVELWIVNPDFVYHWGIKGKKFFQAGGVDFDFLTGRWNWLRHPDYPLLLPSLFAATGILHGRFAEPAMMLWAAVCFAALLAGAREALRLAGVSAFAAQSTLAITAVTCASFGIGYLTAGGPDWLMALVPLVAWPLFLRPADGRSDLAMGLLAGVLVASKVEGIPFAAFLLGLYFLHRSGWRLAFWRTATWKNLPWRAVPWLALPALLIAAPWLWGVVHQQLLMEPRSGPFMASYAGVIFGAIWDELCSPQWRYASFCLFLLPALLFPRATRPIALLALLQLGFYLYVYFASPYKTPHDVEFYVHSNLARLVFHVVPATLVACGIAFDRWLGGSTEPAPELK